MTTKKIYAWFLIIIGLLGLAGSVLFAYMLVWVSLFCGAGPNMCDGVFKKVIGTVAVALVVGILFISMTIYGFKLLNIQGTKGTREKRGKSLQSEAMIIFGLLGMANHFVNSYPTIVLSFRVIFGGCSSSSSDCSPFMNFSVGVTELLKIFTVGGLFLGIVIYGFSRIKRSKEKS